MKYVFKSTEGAVSFCRYLITKIARFEIDAQAEITVKVLQLSMIVSDKYLDEVAKKHGGKKI